MTDHDTLMSLLGQPVTVTRPAGWSTPYRTDTTWTGVLVAFGEEPDLHLKTPSGQISLPISYRVEAAPTPEACCVCGSTDVTYRNYREQPFCAHCADCTCRQTPCAQTADPTPTRAVPVDVLNDLVRVAAHVSMGREAAGIPERYPDPVARHALGALHDHGLLPNHGDDA